MIISITMITIKITAKRKRFHVGILQKQMKTKQTNDDTIYNFKACDPRQITFIGSKII